MKQWLASCVLMFCGISAAEVKLPAIFSDHMVLQRERPINIWGHADAGQTVSVRLADQHAQAVADASGQWVVKLASIAQGENLTLTVAAGNTIELRDILIGDVWICSGQSNMEWSVAQSNNANQEIAAADLPKIRLFRMAKAYADAPQDDVRGQWVVCAAETVGTFSAVGFFFGRDVHQATDIPQGLIDNSWGATPAEPWTEIETLRAVPALRPLVEKVEKESPAMVQERYESQLKQWAELMRQTVYTENKGLTSKFADADLDDSPWKTMPLPGNWEKTLNLEFDGALWVRKEVNLPADWSGKALQLSLGGIDDWEETFFNGQRVGGIGPEAGGGAWNVQRNYSIPPSLVHAGRNVIAVRVFDYGAPGGFGGTAQSMHLSRKENPVATLPLAGDWKYSIEEELKVPAATIPPAPIPPRPQDAPGRLFNALIHPIVQFPIKGVAWYQGENNAQRPAEYRTLLPAMIQSWRRAWGEEFPFLIVQLANFGKEWTDPCAPDDWAELREAQWLTARSLPHCHLVVTIDVGESKDIHPRDKQTVGRRLALQAMKNVYQQEVIASGPEYRIMTIEEDRIRLQFDHAAGLHNRRPAAKSIAIAGKDKIFHWANMTVVGESLIVWSDQVPRPVAARYAWGASPPATLYNGAGLPAVPFRTDDWGPALQRIAP